MSRSERGASVSELIECLSLFWFSFLGEEPFTPQLWWWCQGAPLLDVSPKACLKSPAIPEKLPDYLEQNG
jgi:hypothetical protein